jgi:hypothetical protein
MSYQFFLNNHSNTLLPAVHEDRSGNVNPLRIVSGGLAAATAKTIIAPLNRLTIILQSQGMSSLKHSQSPAYVEISTSFRNILEKEGFKSLWNGNGANVLRVIPNYGLRFALNDVSREWVARLYGLDPDKTRHVLTKWQLLISSSIAAIIQITLTYPIEVISTRLAISGSAIAPVKYDGMIHCFRELIRMEGYSSLYNGYPITLLAGTPYVAIQMSCFELFQRQFHKIFTQNGPNRGDHDDHDDQNNKNNKNNDIGVLPKVFAGSCASLTAQTMTYPGDILRRRMQVDGMGSKRQYAYKSITHAAKTIYQQEGYVFFVWVCVFFVFCLSFFVVVAKFGDILVSFLFCLFIVISFSPNSPIPQLPNYPITQFPPFSPHSNYPSRQYPNTLYTPVGKHFLKVFMSIHFGLSLKAHWYLYWLMFLKKFSILKNMILIEVWVEFHDLPQLQLKHLLSSVQNYFYITFRIYFLV